MKSSTYLFCCRTWADHIPLDLGTQLQVQTPDGQAMPVTVVEVTEAHVTLDANHPLAGQTLTFDVEIVDLRPATPEEIAHGHAHGPGGHHH